MLCRPVLFCVVLCSAMLCYAVLCSVGILIYSACVVTCEIYFYVSIYFMDNLFEFNMYT